MHDRGAVRDRQRHPGRRPAHVAAFLRLLTALALLLWSIPGVDAARFVRPADGPDRGFGLAVLDSAVLDSAAPCTVYAGSAPKTTFESRVPGTRLQIAASADLTLLSGAVAIVGRDSRGTGIRLAAPDRLSVLHGLPFAPRAPPGAV